MDRLLIHFCNTAHPLDHLDSLPDTCYSGMLLIPLTGLLISFGLIMLVVKVFND